MPEAVWFKLCDYFGDFHSGVEVSLRFRRRNISNGLEQTPVVEPIDPFERCVFDGFDGAPRSASMDDLRFEETVDGFRQSVVIAVADAADGRLDPGFGQTPGIFDRQILDPPWAPRSEWWISPIAFEGRRWCTACSNASGTKPVLAVRLTRQPTIILAKASMTKAT